MDKLRIFYQRYTKICVGLLIVGGVLIGKYVIPLIETNLVTTFCGKLLTVLVTSSALFGILFLGVSWLIKKWVWKLFHNELNFSGVWEGRSYYTKIEIGKDGVSRNEKSNVVNSHCANIKQNCLEIQIETSHGPDILSWRTLATDLSDGILRYAYEAQYNEAKVGKKEAKGYEEMRVLQRNRWGKPILLSGVFSHCADGERPIYSGKVIFFRKENVEEINTEKLDPQFKAEIDKNKQPQNKKRKK